ncbi:MULTISPECIES: DUF2630 family protein [Streptomyces]|uniref:DUF2630 domain-containing protein n=2 Tax=Streptomyces TaxID=1883 RepID=A0A117QA68_STRCK|nr:DUF2630 family protein [Streptomyces corchorusii]AEY85980.1 hypothetical protein SHJG_0703 [Streptomyces hygroscopicus subsp. jinggangensis 5008]AGF60202.1 hypothetical protein SHJGH_0536 [Streptomyces hygroscopicus subsp. jinggangensis TL01]ALO99528.1 hypothetical protein SHL15_8586 [Streptomyces hygroscopicus subsp. limoneus]KUN17141.1 hypothetical protein AQJ11_38385 [Streptomyces corchorusii]
MTTGPGAEAEKQIIGRITEMINQEKDLRDRLADHDIDQPTEQERLARLETELDQCWDLLRQRRARAAAGQDPDGAEVRPASQVERYLS